MSRRYLHTLCVLVLLVAQQGALFHATWHASGDGRAHVHNRHAAIFDADRELPTGQGTQGGLCAFDLAFGQVLGGVHGACALQVAAELPAGPAPRSFNPRLSAEAVPALSRRPPVIL